MPWKYLLYKSSIFLILIPIVWILLSIFTYVNYNIYNVDKIEKVDSMMYSRSTNSKSYHEEKNVCFAYFNGDIKLKGEESFDLSSKSDSKRYKALTEEHKYYKFNDPFVVFMITITIIFGLLLLVVYMFFNYSDKEPLYDKDRVEIMVLKTNIVKGVMTFCNVPIDKDAALKTISELYPKSSYSLDIPTYKEIWYRLKQEQT